MRKKDKPKTTPETTETTGTEPVVVPAVVASVPSYPPAWTERVGAFAAVVGKTLEQVTEVLKPHVGDPGEAALDALSGASFEDLKDAMTSLGVPPLVAKNKVALLRGAPALVAETTSERPAGPSFDILPIPPDDVSFLAALKVGGNLKVDTTEVVSAMKAALAGRFDMFGMLKKVSTLMEQTADESEEPCPAEYYTVQRLITRRGYAEVLAALDIEGTVSMSEAKKNAFLKKLNDVLWNALYGFNDQLDGWYRSWTAGMNNPGMLAMVMSANLNGGVGGAMPNLLQPPDTATVRDAAETFNNTVNKVFSGTGIPVARALALDVLRIREVLEKHELPVLTGSASRDIMLRKLGTEVTTDYVRLEHGVTRYALGVMGLSKTGGGQNELNYLQALYMLGVSIPWDMLLRRPVTPPDSDRPRRREPREPERY